MSFSVFNFGSRGPCFKKALHLLKPMLRVLQHASSRRGVSIDQEARFWSRKLEYLLLLHLASYVLELKF